MGYSFLLAGNVKFDVAKIYESDAWANKKDTTHKPWMQDLSRTQQLEAVIKMLTTIGKLSN